MVMVRLKWDICLQRFLGKSKCLVLVVECDSQLSLSHFVPRSFKVGKGILSCTSDGRAWDTPIPAILLLERSCVLQSPDRAALLNLAVLCLVESFPST